MTDDADISYGKSMKVVKKTEKDFTEKINAPTAMKNEVRASGVCGKCRKRYTAVPVINGVPQCPNCDHV